MPDFVQTPIPRESTSLSRVGNVNPTGTATSIEPTGESFRITEDGQIREFEDGTQVIVDR